VHLFSGMFQLETFPTGLDMEFCLEALEIALYRWAKSHRFPLRSGVVSSPRDFVQGFKTEESRSAGLVEALVRQTSWWRDYERTVKYE